MNKNVFRNVIVCMLLVWLGPVLVEAGQSIPKKVAITLPEAATDKGWNQRGAEGLKKIADKYGFEVVIAEALGYQNIKPVLRDLSQKGCELIIAHAAGYMSAAPEVARETGVKVVTCLNSRDITPGLISNYDFKSGGGGYLAGVLAGRMTRSNVVGICAGAEPSNFNRLSAGFIQGLKTVKPDATLLHSVIGPQSYADAAGGKRNTADMIAVGADVIFGMGDGSSFGMLQACFKAKAPDGGKVWFIDAIGDKTDIDSGDVILSSVLFDFSILFDEIIQSLSDGSFGKQHWVHFQNGSVYLLEPNRAVPNEVRLELGEVAEKIKSGESSVVDIPLAADLHKYLRQMFPLKKQ
jgi:simple sugar transport system substrate-binding protein